MTDAIYDLRRLVALHEALAALDVTATPTARVLIPDPLPPVRRVGMLCGSFNPLTLAHTELAERAREIARLDLVFFTLAKVTIDKERVTGLSLEDRLLLLALYAQRQTRTGVALVNRGLYFEQAQAFRSALGEQVELSFVVGMDKLLQILDPKYYQDRDAALRQLFALTSLIIANRGEMAREEFDRILDRPENRPYRFQIQFCPLSETVTNLSATEVREGLAAGRGIEEWVPPETATFLAETRAFRAPLEIGKEQVDAYAVRQNLLNLLFVRRSQHRGAEEFHSLYQEALSEGEAGQALRKATFLD
jgi:nicotinic acid mononucleotide adenylyltransferase